MTRELGMAYGACESPEAGHASRITVVVDGDGKVARVYPNVDPKGHPAEVLADLSQGNP
jgi:peroxiredoxin